MKSRWNRKLSGFVIVFIVSIGAATSYGNGEQDESSAAVEFTGYSLEVSSTRDRDLVKAGVWLTDQGKLVNAGIYYTRKRNETFQYGFDTSIGYLAPVYRFWPFAMIGVKIGSGTVITAFHAEVYPKVGVAVPLFDQVLLYGDYQYNRSSQGHRHDYGAASVGIVWRVE